MDEAKSVEQYDDKIELLARQVARNKTNVAQWGLNIAVLLFGLLIVTIILVSLGVDTLIVSSTAILGLIVVWIVGRKRGKLLYARFYTEEMINLQQAPSKEILTNIKQLTQREMQVLHLVAQGYANKRIARELGITESTVKRFISNVLTKLNANDRTEAAVIAMKNGVITIK